MVLLSVLPSDLHNGLRQCINSIVRFTDRPIECEPANILDPKISEQPRAKTAEIRINGPRPL